MRASEANVESTAAPRNHLMRMKFAHFYQALLLLCVCACQSTVKQPSAERNAGEGVAEGNALDLEPANPSEHAMLVSDAGSAESPSFHHSYRRKGEELWACDLPFRLHEARVLSSRRVVGYGYSGSEVHGRELALMILGEGGRIVLSEVFERRGSSFHWGRFPLGLAVFGSEQRDRVVFRMWNPSRNGPPEEWRSFRASDGGELAVVRPQEWIAEPPLSYRELYGAQSFDGLPLELAYYVQYQPLGDYYEVATVVFVLVDSSGEIVWSARTDDSGPLEAVVDVYERHQEDVEAGRLVLDIGDHEFSVLDLWLDSSITYSVERQGEGWQVRELRRQPYRNDVATGGVALAPIAIDYQASR